MTLPPIRLLYPQALRPEPSLVAPAITVRGRFTWAVLNPDGSVDRSGAQDNLVTDSGLDYLMQAGAQGVHYAVCVGVGNSTPSFANTRLDAVVYRYAQTEYLSGMAFSGGGFSANGEYRSYRRWLFPLGALEANLAEVGFSHNTSFNSGVNIRQLFRDAQGTPQVVSVARDQQLRVQHEFYYRFPIGLSPMTWTVEGFPPLVGQGGWLRLRDGVEGWYPNNGEQRNGLAQPHTSGELVLGMLGSSPQPNERTDTNMPYLAGYSNTGHTFGTFFPEPYVLGSFERRKTVEIGPDDYNRDFNFIGYGLYAPSNTYDWNTMWGFFFDSPSKVTKLDTHRLRLSLKWKIAREAL